MPLVPEYKDRFLLTTGKAAKNDIAAPEAVLHAAFESIIAGDFDAFGQSVAASGITQKRPMKVT